MKPFDPAQNDTVVNQNFAANGVPGQVISVRTNLGNRVHAWRPTPNHNVRNPQSIYFCHGFSLGTFDLGYSILSGESMVRVLADEYVKICTLGASDDAVVKARDLLVWWKYKDPIHSAIVDQPILIVSVNPLSRRLDPNRTLVSSKTGTGVVRLRVRLALVKQDYNEQSIAIEVYRKH